MATGDDERLSPSGWKRLRLRSGFATPNPERVRWQVEDLESGNQRWYVWFEELRTQPVWVLVAVGAWLSGRTSLALLIAGGVIGFVVWRAVVRRPDVDRLRRNILAHDQDTPPGTEPDWRRLQRGIVLRRVYASALVLIVVAFGAFTVVDVDTDSGGVDVSAFFLRCEGDPKAPGVLRGAAANHSAERIQVTLRAMAETDTETYDDTFGLVLAEHEERLVEIETGLTRIVRCLLEVQQVKVLDDR